MTTSNPQNSLSQQFSGSLLEQMIYYRRFEEQVQFCYTQQMFSGFCHLHIGQEGLCVGVQNALEDDDYMITGYRSHTQAIAKGISPYQVLSELFAKEHGCSRGKGGSMHMFSNEKRFFGGHGIVGGQVPIAVGIGFKISYHQENSIVVCYMGDGALNQGQAMEAFNLAAIWSLPVLFIIENNLYGMGTHVGRICSLKPTELHQRALGYNIDSSQINGQDVLDVYFHTKEIVDSIRSNNRPYLLEALTYRYKGHSVSDPSLYRTKEELDKYKNHHDPITTLSQYLITNNHFNQQQINKIDSDIKNKIKLEIKKAQNAPEPKLTQAFEDLYQ